MLSILQHLSLFLLVSLTLTAATDASYTEQLLSTRQNEVTVSITEFGTKVIRFNGYDIINCGNARNKTSKAVRLLGFLSQMKIQLERVVADAKLGTRSQHGYTAFFKSNRNIRKVTTAFQSLVDPLPIIVSEERVAENWERSRTPQPAFLCINENDDRTAAIMEECKSGPLSKIALIWPGTELLAVCPDFFTTMKYPTAEQACPTLQGGKFKPGDGKLMESSFAYVVYLLVTMYDRGLSATRDWQKLWDMNNALELNSRQSVLSGENYGFYAGGGFMKCTFNCLCNADLSIAVQAGCTNFPRTSGRNGELRLR